MYKNFDFKILSRLGMSRVGAICTPHGIVHTPAFIFCATNATVKSITADMVQKCGTQIILSNTYHLMIQPGVEVVEALGGLHNMLNWNGPMLTDSGGYQIFSLGCGSVSEELKGKRRSKNSLLVRVHEEGATFKSYTDGSIQYLTPEKSIRIQKKLGADLVVVLDECTAFHSSYEYTEQSMHMSTRWATRSLREFENSNDGSQALYCVIQGGIYETLRRVSCDFANKAKFFGNAIGGSLGSCKQQMYDTVSTTTRMLDDRRPIHLLGIGNIDDIFQGVEYGIDTFDCVYPTRIARHGAALVKVKHRQPDMQKKEYINLNNATFQKDSSPIEHDCSCFTCKRHSRGYIHHLLKARELLAYTLITAHNIHFINSLMQAIRDAISNGTLEQEKLHWTI